MTNTAVIPGERRVVIELASWSLYQSLRAEIGDGHVRLTYDCGRLEITSSSPRHESVKKILARLIETYAEAAEILTEGFGSTTFDREDLQKGLEPDECYYVQHAAAMIGKETIDLSTDPPPDLAIEVDISPPEVGRQPIYGALGVPEVWRYDGRSVEFLRREVDGRYIAVEQSISFPQLSVRDANDLLVIRLSRGQMVVATEIRKRF